MYKEFKQPIKYLKYQIPNICDKTLLLSSICNKCGI